MIILLTNDDGIYAPGLAALEPELRKLGDVFVVAPMHEQSGVGHAITYLTPLIVKEVFVGQRRWGWAVEGSPADCVKIAVSEICPPRPDLIVSGINTGLNAGINVLYSGTVAAAIEGAFFRIPSIAVSLEYDDNPRFDRAANIARQIIEQLWQRKGPETQLFNVNIPQAALTRPAEVRVVPMDVNLYSERYEKRLDPYGRPYYWLVGTPPKPAEDGETDLSALAQGYVTVTPLRYNMTEERALIRLRQEGFVLREERMSDAPGPPETPGPLPGRARLGPRGRRSVASDTTG